MPVTIMEGVRHIFEFLAGGLAMTGIGAAYFDDVRIEPLVPSSAARAAER